MAQRSIETRRTKELGLEPIRALYRANGWSAAEKPEALGRAIAGSDFVVSAWDGDQLVGIGNALTDGHLVVYYPHLLVAEGAAIALYEGCGFAQAGRTRSMWIYQGDDH